MNKYFLLIFGMLLIIPTSVAIADTTTSSNEILDIVVEWSPGGNNIQIGDYFIGNIPKVFIDSGGKNLAKGNNSDISLGSLVRVSGINKVQNGTSWQAEKIVVLVREGKQNALDQLSIERRESLKESMARFSRPHELLKPAKSSQKVNNRKNTLYLENGIWKN